VARRHIVRGAFNTANEPELTPPTPLSPYRPIRIRTHTHTYYILVYNTAGIYPNNHNNATRLLPTTPRATLTSFELVLGYCFNSNSTVYMSVCVRDSKTLGVICLVRPVSLPLQRHHHHPRGLARTAACIAIYNGCATTASPGNTYTYTIISYLRANCF